MKNQILKVTKGLAELLIYKNKKYGNAALEPLGVFNKKNSTEGILIRLDDKLMRIKNNKKLSKNNVVDLVGYLILLCISKSWDNFNEFKD